MKSCGQSGNVLFLILIAVALFAALSYAITQSTRNNSSMSSEDVAIAAASAIQYVSAVEAGITKIKTMNNCSDDQISFENPFVGGYVNGNAPSNKTCHVFDPAGGGVVWRKLPDDIFDADFSANTHYGNVFFTGYNQVPNVGTASVELLMLIPFITRDMCLAFNKKFGLGTGSPARFNSIYAVAATKFVGTYAYAALFELPFSNGLLDGCGHATSFAVALGAPAYIYYHVLIPR